MTDRKDTVADLDVVHENQNIERDVSRVICRLLMYGRDPARVKSIIARILELDEEETNQQLEDVVKDFSHRHKNIQNIFDRNYQQVNSYITSQDYSKFSREKVLLIGAYFTMEYSVESAALFNPSIVPHPDQSDVPDGSLRFIMSLRAVGEGHISSMVFREGIIDEEGALTLDPCSSYLETPDVRSASTYDRHLFRLKLDSMGMGNEVSEYVIDKLPEHFTREELIAEISKLSDKPRFPKGRQQEGFNTLHQLADSNYQLNFDPDTPLSERVIFPVSKEESGGIEDARFVDFTDENGDVIYYATYTAYNGRAIMPQLVITEDFRHFKMRTLNGKAAQNKGMALFPRKIDGKYVMLSRQDGENNRIMFSDNLRFWQKSQIIQQPKEPWEFIQLGNCGSPVETDEGWLVLTHGVGALRTYSIGAILLDLDDPTKVIGHLKKPMLQAFDEQRNGYVPNVVYTCGYMRHNDQLIIPYSISDIQPAVARVNIHDLIDAMERV